MSSSGRSANNINVQWRSSARLLVLLSVVFAAASLSLGLLVIEGYYLLLFLLPLVLFVYTKAVRKHVFLTLPVSITGLRRDSSNCWYVRRLSGENACRLLANSYASGSFMVLRFAEDGCFQSTVVVIFADAMDKKSYRHLLVNLRTQPGICEQT